ncbi:hypothetical protein CVT25_010022 [Psilocybe cyanescens]|uniref:Uncharacterized protein n=1 Tax=Psilocybe cyanescens TaxID=93625 RepID=A0A409X3B9_PSICY|nr:hypothetical protein CVT25_010022 [Psilocybe cyanescens]
MGFYNNSRVQNKSRTRVFPTRLKNSYDWSSSWSIKKEIYQSEFLCCSYHVSAAIPTLSSFEAMEAEVDRKDDEASFNKQLESLKISHYEDLEKLYDMNMEEYADSLQEQYLTRDHTSQQQEIYEEQRMAIVARKLLEKMFPLLKEDFDSKPMETTLRTGRFLVANPARQGRLLNNYGWAWRQVQPLIDIFKKDMVFASNVRSMVICSQSVTDPRRPRPVA